MVLSVLSDDWADLEVMAKMLDGVAMLLGSMDRSELLAAQPKAYVGMPLAALRNLSALPANEPMPGRSPF